jgi:serine O-acetyltransferase
MGQERRRRSPDSCWVVDDGITLQRGKLTLPELFAVFAEEYDARGRDWRRPGFRAIIMYRFGVWALSLDRSSVLTNLRGRLLSMIYLFAHRYVRDRYGIELHREATVGRGVEFVHQGCVAIQKYARIGDRCRIMHDVTIGSAGRGSGPEHAPTLESDVQVGAGARVLGKIVVGEGARIGPNVVVITNIPPTATVVAQAPRIIYAPSTAEVREELKELQMAGDE